MNALFHWMHLSTIGKVDISNHDKRPLSNYMRLVYPPLRAAAMLEDAWSPVITCSSIKRRPRNHDVIKWKHFPRYWPFVRGIHRSPVNSPHKGQWCRALMFSLICVWINGWVNNREAGDLRRYRAHYDVIVMVLVRGGFNKIQVLYSLKRHRLIGIGIPIINLRRSSDRIKFVFGIPIPVSRCLLSE